MTHTVLAPGDLVHYDGWLCGWMTARVLDIVTVPGAIPGTLRNDVRIKITARNPHSAFKTGETLTVRSCDVLPRTGWRRSGTTRWHSPGYCHAWESCDKCGRTVVPQQGVTGFPYLTLTMPDSGHVLVTGAANPQHAWQSAEAAGHAVHLASHVATGTYSLTLHPRVGVR